MTLQQEAYEKIMKLPDDGVRLIIALADALTEQTYPSQHSNPGAEKKKKAYQDMLEMKKRSTFPKDLDPKKIKEEALNERFGYTT